MQDERRYRDDEVREIFDRATADDEPQPPVAREGIAPLEAGLTLSELQDVGREVGLAPGRVAAAAAALDRRSDVLPRATSLGAPTGVGRVIELPRAATDREWQMLVGDLRETFGAQGRVVSHGAIHEWRNGNLHASLEPTPTGHRLRLGTKKTGSKEANVMGVAGLAIGLLLAVTAGLDEATFGTMRATLIPILMMLASGGLLVGNALRLRAWAAERERQMEYIAGRARALLASPPEPEP